MTQEPSEERVQEALRMEREKVKELEAQVAVIRAAFLSIKSRVERLKYGEDFGNWPDYAEKALSSDVAKRHLDLDALKDRVVEASKKSREAFAALCREAVRDYMSDEQWAKLDIYKGSVTEIDKALSALGAKEKEGVK